MDVHASDVDGDPHRAMAGRNGSLPMHGSDSDGRTIVSVATAPREPGTVLSGPRVGKADRPMTLTEAWIEMWLREQPITEA